MFNSVVEPAKIIEKAEMIQVTSGEPAILEYTVTGTPELKTKWFKDGKALPASKKYRISFKNNIAQLKFYATEMQDSGEYTFEISNDVGISSCTTSFTVLGWYCLFAKSPVALLCAQKSQKQNSTPVLLMCSFLSFFSLSTDRTIPPFFTKPLKNIDSVISTSCRLDCKISGSLPMTVSWFKQDTEITSSAKYTVHFAEGSASLEIKHLDTNDAGVYICRATNSAGSKESSSTLFIKGLAICLTILGILLIL